MTTTMTMIRRIRDIQNARGGISTGFATLLDIRLSTLLVYLRHRHYRDTGLFSPI